MAKVKIYQSLIGQKHNTTVVVNGQDMRIEFSDAEGDAKGIYTTTLPEVQAGIESNPAFNKRYRLLKEYGDDRKGMDGPGILIHGATTGEVLREANLLAGQSANAAQKTEEVEPKVTKGTLEDIDKTAPDTKETIEQEFEETEGGIRTNTVIGAPEETIEEVVETAVEETAPVVEDTKTADPVIFRNVAQAQDFFGKPPYNIVKTKIRTSAEVIAKAKELGVDIIFQK